ncbi:MAG: hypothetical protein LQ341_004118, partial [Variospora aurantia]
MTPLRHLRSNTGRFKTKSSTFGKFPSSRQASQPIPDLIGGAERRVCQARAELGRNYLLPKILGGPS